MRIGFIACARKQSGIADYTRDLREALQKREDVATFLISGRCYCPPSISHGNYDCLAFHDSRFERFILGGMQLAVSRMLRRFKPRLLYRGLQYQRSMRHYCPDIVHYQMDREIFGITPLSIISQKRNFGLIATLHEFEFEVDEKLYSRVLGNLDKVIVHSNYSRKKLLNYLDDENKIELIHFGVWVDNELEQHRDQISIFGIHSQFKRYESVIDAVELVKRQFKRDVVVHFYGYVGESTKRKYNKILKIKGLDDSIIFHGPLSEDAFHKCLRHSQFIITPYEDSHASSIILKAMGHGTAVLSSCVGSIPEYLGEMGEYFFLGNPMSLAEKIVLLMEDPLRRNAIGKGLWEKAKTEFSWDMIAKKTLRVYEEVL